MKRPIAAALLAGVAWLSAGQAVAHADAADDRFLAAVAAQGVNVDPAALLNAGHAICNTVGTPGAVPVFYGLQAQGLSPPQVSNVLMSAVNTYCPDKAALLPHLP